MEDGAPRRYPAEFRRKILDLVTVGGRSSKSHDLQISAQAIYTWRRQQLIDSGQVQGMTSSGHAELVAVRKQIAQMENEMVIHRRAASSSAMWCPQKALCGDHGNR